MNDHPPTSFHQPLPQEQWNPPPSEMPSPYRSSPWQQPEVPPAWQPGYPAPQNSVPYGSSMTVPLRVKGFAPVGLILGIISFVVGAGVFTGVPALAVISLIAGLLISALGVVFSALSLRSVSRKGMAILGLVLSIIAFVLLVLITIIALLIAFRH